MTKTKISLSWKITAILTAVIIFTLSVCSYASDMTADAASSTRTYWRHDYGTYVSSYYEYSLTTSVYNNSSRSIIGNNDMVRDYDTSVVRLSTGGTGFIIGEHIIVTAAHCVYDYTFLDFTISIVDSNNTVIKAMVPEYIHIPKEYGDNYDKNYDYALIYVADNLSEYGMFNLGVALDEYITNQGTVTVSGFPEEYPDGYDFNNLGWGIKFKATGNILASSDEGFLLYYNADTAGGDSGGPVYIEEGIQFNGALEDYKTVIAINVAHAEDESYNKGVRITADLLKFYYGNSYLIA